ncbi:hypothetical protein CI610_03591 [invertebrate metagenome]|uniref:Uncharacterized protein n=1 Tax=invertebrate metagenome TaxID=1711999 RepID=A0A2H9T2N0_9ZZZZ
MSVCLSVTKLEAFRLYFLKTITEYVFKRRFKTQPEREMCGI